MSCALFRAAQLISAAQTIVSRNISPCQCGVVTFGQVANAGVASNVIPTDLTLFGTTRAFRIEERDLIRSRLRKLCEGFSIAFEAEISVKFHVDGLRAAGYPPTVNHKSEYQKVVAAAAEVVGEKKVTPGSLPTMAAEDFSYFLQKCKGCFFMVGAGKPDGVPRPHHSSYFDIDEKSLLISASVFVKIVENSLINKSSNSNSAGTPTCTATSSCCE